MGSSRPRWRWVAAALLAMVVGTTALPAHRASAQTSPVQDAQSLYGEARFDEAITMLRDAISTGRVAGADAVAARELLARCLVRSGNRIEAKEAFKGLLRADPTYRPASSTMPPDEFETYELARREYEAEQIEAGERVPASLSLHYGVGSGANTDLAEVAVAGGGADEYDVDPSFGGAVRFPVRPRWSLEIELQRFRATNADSFPGDNQARYEITAMPLSLSLYYATLVNPKWRVNVFGGLGMLLAATSSIRFDLGTATLAITDQKNGFYGHAGVEGEYLVHPRIAFFGRVLGRVATATDLYEDTDLEAYGTAQLSGREINFSGFGAHLGVRAYVGY